MRMDLNIESEHIMLYAAVVWLVCGGIMVELVYRAPLIGDKEEL